MKNFIKKYTLISICVLLMLYVVKVNAQSKEPCTWRTDNITEFELCIDKLREVHDKKIIDDVNTNEYQNSVEYKDTYEYLSRSYKKLLNYYGKGAHQSMKKEEEFLTKKKSLEIKKD